MWKSVVHRVARSGSLYGDLQPVVRRGCLAKSNFAARPQGLTGIRTSQGQFYASQARDLRDDTVSQAESSQPRRVPVGLAPAAQSIPPVIATHIQAGKQPIAVPDKSVYRAPKDGILSFLPTTLVPFAELSRIDKPIGTYYLLVPCLWSTFLAAPLTTPITGPTTILTTSLLFIAGATIMRGAGCTINDMWDRRIDAQVSRTRLRPLARGAVSMPAATVWLGVQLFAGLGILLQFPAACFWYAAPSLAFVALYPAAKRVIDYPQFVLGLTFSWGAIMGFPALGVDLLTDHAAALAAAALYASNVAWTVLYDMVYAHQDLRDDKLAGVRSIVRRWEGHTKSIMTGLAVVQTAFLGAAGMALGVGPVYYAGVLGASVIGNGLQIWRVKLDDPADCWWWFRYSVWITGGSILAGMSAEYAMQYLGFYDQHTDEEAQADNKISTI